MNEFFRRLFAPWKASAQFDSDDAFFSFLVRRNKFLNAVRVVFFAAAAVLLLIGYAAVSVYPWYYFAAGAMAAGLLVSLAIMKNEKELPEELRQK